MKLKVWKSSPSLDWTEVPGWDETKKEYVDLHCERWLEENRIRDLGRENGEQEYPASDATQPDEVHQKIRAWINRRGRGCKNAVSKFLALQMYTLELQRKEGMAPIRDKVEGLRDDAIGKLEDRGATERANLNQFAREAQEARRDLNAFRKDARLDRVAEDCTTARAMFLVLGAVVFGEAVYNAFMLAGVYETGLAGAVIVFLTIGIVNTAILGALVGEGWRFKNSVRRMTSSGGLLMIIAGGVGLLTLNLFVGHFRDSLQSRAARPDLSIEELLTDDSIPRFLANPIGLDGLPSYLLVIVGIGAGLFAATKWFGRDDPYPGYGRKYRRDREHHRRYLEASRDSRALLEEIYRESADKITDARLQLENKKGQYRLLTDTARRIVGDFSMHLRQYQDDLDFLIAAYRTENEKARTTPAPVFFKDRPVIDEEMLGAPEWSDIPAPDYDEDWAGFRDAIRTVQTAYQQATNALPVPDYLQDTEGASPEFAE